MSEDDVDREETLDEDLEGGDESGTLESESGGDTTEKRMKDQLAEITKLQQERADMRREVDELRGMVKGIGQSAHREPEYDPLAEYDDEDFDEKFLEKPSVHLKRVLEMTGNGFVHLERKLQKMFDEKFREVGRSSLDEATRSKIEELKKNPKLASLDDEVLLEIVKDAPKVKRGAREYPGAPPGGGRVSSGSATDAADEKEVKAWMAKLGFSTEDKKNA